MKRISLSFLMILICASVAGQKINKALLNPKDKAWKVESPDIFKVKVSTTKGDFVIEIHKTWGRIGANRFYNLVRNGFYDDSRFYRIREGAFAQFGIPGNPKVAQVWQHESMADDSVAQSNERSFIAYAMTGPNARTTQLFINLKNNAHQDKDGFAPIGRVISGMEVVDALYAGYAESSGGGMRGGKQGRLFEEGNAYLDREFPKLDKLLKAEIVK
jgi:cyclophilin family peptidyl-prolyl cis-trans isomerase